MEAEFEAVKEETQHVLQVLEALKQASQDLQTHPHPCRRSDSSDSIKALLDLDSQSDSILSNDPNLSNLSHHISTLKSLIDTFQNYSGRHGLKSFLARRGTSHEISGVAGSIESEIQAWIDRESVEKLTKALQRSSDSLIDEEIPAETGLVELIQQFEQRISRGFDLELQDLILKSKVFGLLEAILCNSRFNKNVREESALAISELIQFNKDVFVSQVLMGHTIRALISMASSSSLKVLCSLIKSIKSPLVDEIESNGEIPKIISLLTSPDLPIRTMAMDCILEIGYFGRKEAIEAMLNSGLMKKLVELQRSELGGDLIEVGKFEEKEINGMVFLEDHPFASCVARFAVQLEVGEGLRQRERRAFKQEILKRIREASVSDAEAATIIAEVLWGSSP